MTFISVNYGGKDGDGDGDGMPILEPRPTGPGGGDDE